MPTSRFHSDWWSAEVPEGWTADEDATCASFVGPRGVLQVSAALKQIGDLSALDLQSVARELFGLDIRFLPCRVGNWPGLEGQWQEDTVSWHVWFLRSGNLMLLATHSAEANAANSDTGALQSILTSLRAARDEPYRLSAARALAAGQVFINIPVLVIILGAPVIAWVATASIAWTALSMVGGIPAAWLWWSFATPRWRSWAHDRGAPQATLQGLAERGGLVWRKGSMLEKTELRRR